MLPKFEVGRMKRYCDVILRCGLAQKPPCDSIIDKQRRAEGGVLPPEPRPSNRFPFFSTLPGVLAYSTLYLRLRLLNYHTLTSLPT